MPKTVSVLDSFVARYCMISELCLVAKSRYTSYKITVYYEVLSLPSDYVDRRTTWSPIP